MGPVGSQFSPFPCTPLLLGRVVFVADADGCRGGVIQWAFDYVNMNDGVNTEPVYPYVGKASALVRVQAAELRVCVH